ncbi:hypothetical protein BH11PLA2_BH11PLA2_44000 [soil metagenome]
MQDAEHVDEAESGGTSFRSTPAAATYTLSAEELSLDQSHLDELRVGSGLSDEIIREADIYTSRDARDNAHHIGWERLIGDLGHAIAFPVPDPTGESSKSVATILKFDKPRMSRKDGRERPVKYESPKGRKSIPYMLPSVVTQLKDVSTPAVVTEGIKKQLRLTQAGYAAIAIPGVWACLVKMETQEGDPVMWGLCPELAAINWQGRRVAIIFDSDAVNNPLVMAAEKRWAEVLKAAGAVVAIVRIPEGDCGEKFGADDYIAKFGEDAFDSLVQEAQPADVAAEAVYAADDPVVLAKRWLRENCVQGVYTCRYHAGDHRVWRHGNYEVALPDDLDSVLTRWSQDEFASMNAALQKAFKEGLLDKEPPPAFQASRAKVAEIIHAVKAVTALPSTTKVPAWISANPVFDACNAVAFMNGVLDLQSRRFVDATPKFFCTAATDYDYDPDAPRPELFLKTLTQYFPNDPDSIACLQEWFGYTIAADTTYHKMLVLIGPKRSGKGTMVRIIERLIGTRNFSSMSFKSFGSNFGLSQLIDKSVAVIPDGRLDSRDSAAVVERVLSITGEDSIFIDRKHRDPVSTKLPTRIILASNELPKLSDASGAIASRMVIIRFTNSFFGVEDKGLTARLIQELPGIARWALEGLVRLRQQGRFTEPASGLKLSQQMADIASPVAAFAREKLVVDAEGTIATKDAFILWKHWCDEAGRRSGSESTFGKDLMAAIPGIDKIRPRTEFGRTQEYAGIRERTYQDTDDDPVTSGHTSGHTSGQQEKLQNQGVVIPVIPVISGGNYAGVREGRSDDDSRKGDAVGGRRDRCDQTDRHVFTARNLQGGAI